MRRQFRRFQDEGVTCGDRRGDFPGRLQQWEVPRGDHPADTHRLIDHGGDDRPISGIDEAARVMVGDLAEVPEAVRDVVDVALCLDQAFSGVQGLGAGELILALDQGIGNLEQEVATLTGGHRRPHTGIESPTGSRDGFLGVSGSRLRHHSHHFPVRRTGHGTCSTIRGRHPRPLDVQRLWPGHSGFSHATSLLLLLRSVACHAQERPRSTTPGQRHGPHGSAFRRPRSTSCTPDAGHRHQEHQR